MEMLKGTDEKAKWLVQKYIFGLEHRRNIVIAFVFDTTITTSSFSITATV